MPTTTCMKNQQNQEQQATPHPKKKEEGKPLPQKTTTTKGSKHPNQPQENIYDQYQETKIN